MPIHWRTKETIAVAVDRIKSDRAKLLQKIGEAVVADDTSKLAALKQQYALLSAKIEGAELVYRLAASEY